MKKEETVTFTHQDANEEYDEKGNIIYKDKLFSTIHKLNQNLGHYKKDLFLTWLFVALETLCEILIPFIMQYLIDEINVQNGLPNLTNVALWALLMLFLAVCGVVFGILAGYWAASCSSGLGHNLRKNMYYHIQDFSFYNIDKFSSSSIVTRMTTDVTNVQFAYQMTIRALLRAPMLMVFALIMSFISSWQLAFVFLAIIPFIGICLILLANKAHPYFIKIFRKYDDLNEDVQENVTGIRTVKAFGRQQQQIEKFEGSSSFIYRMFIKVERLLALNAPIMSVASYATMLIICYVGAVLITTGVSPTNPVGVMTTGQITTLLSYSMQILLAMMLIMMVYVMIIMARNSAERIIHVLEEETDIYSPADAVMEVKDGEVTYDHVCFHFKDNPEHDVLKDINLHFKSGEVVGIVGSTGSSKSTLMSLLARLYDVTSGSVQVGGVDVRKYDLTALREAVAVVLQKNTLFTGTIKDNLRWGNLNATDEEIVAACKMAQADSFIQSFPDKYETQIVEGGKNVSGGQKQRLCIARALLKKPKILILDDSTSAVDTHTDSLLRKALQEAIPGTTKFIIAERVLSVKDADTILVMDDGKVIAKGDHETLLNTCPMYKELVDSQLGGGDFDATGE